MKTWRNGWFNREKLNIDTSFKDFMEVDKSVVTKGTLLTDSEILKNICETSDEDFVRSF